MNTYKSLGLASLAAAALLVGQAYACPIVNGMQTNGSPVCIAPYGPADGAATGLIHVLAGPDNTADYNSNSIFSSGMGLDPYTDQSSPSSYWAVEGTGGSENTVMFTMSSATPNTTFGIFDPSHTNNRLALFTDGTAGYTTTLKTDGQGGFAATYYASPNPLASPTGHAIASFSDGNLFGYYLQVDGTTFYSDMSLNSDGIAHMANYAGNGDTVRMTNGAFSAGEFLQAWEDTALNKGSDLDYNDFIVMVESVHAVPEPAVLGMFGFGVLLIGGFVALRRRRYNA